MDRKVKVAKRGVKVEVCTMEPDAGSRRPNPESSPNGPRRAIPVPARSPLVAAPTGKRIRSSPTVLPPLEGKTTRLPMDAPEPKRRFNRVGIALAVVICLGTIPFTYQFQKNKMARRDPADTKTDYDIPVEKRQFRMKHLEGLTDKQAIARFGTPHLARNFNMNDGAFAGPAVGMKRFYLKTQPDFEARTKDAEAVWTFPQFQVIREVVWEFPDSYLYVWMREPRAEIDIADNPGLVELPVAPDGGDWVVIDNFRVGKDLLKPTPVAGE